MGQDKLLTIDEKVAIKGLLAKKKNGLCDFAVRMTTCKQATFIFGMHYSKSLVEYIWDKERVQALRHTPDVIYAVYRKVDSKQHYTKSLLRGIEPDQEFEGIGGKYVLHKVVDPKLETKRGRI